MNDKLSSVPGLAVLPTQHDLHGWRRLLDSEISPIDRGDTVVPEPSVRLLRIIAGVRGLTMREIQALGLVSE